MPLEVLDAWFEAEMDGVHWGPARLRRHVWNRHETLSLCGLAKYGEYWGGIHAERTALTTVCSG
jgi:hypothetical protein